MPWVNVDVCPLNVFPTASDDATVPIDEAIDWPVRVDKLDHAAEGVPCKELINCEVDIVTDTLLPVVTAPVDALINCPVNVTEPEY